MPDTKPSAAPSTQPTSNYDKFADVTRVWIGFAGIRIGYAYEGQQAPTWFDRLTLSIDPGIAVNGDSLIFLVDGSRRVRLQLDDKHSAAVSVEWLSQFVGAKSIDVNTGDPAAGTSLTDPQITSIKALLEKTGYFSPARRHYEDERKLVWTPGKRLVYIIDTRGRMLTWFSSIRRELRRNVLDHPSSGVGGFFLAENSDGKVKSVHTPEIGGTDGAKRIGDFIEELFPSGETVHFAFDSAIAIKPDAIVFLTTESSATLDKDLPGVEAKLLASKIPLNILVFSDRDDERYKHLAALTKGLYRRIGDDQR